MPQLNSKLKKENLSSTNKEQHKSRRKCLKHNMSLQRKTSKLSFKMVLYQISYEQNAMPQLNSKFKMENLNYTNKGTS